MILPPHGNPLRSEVEDAAHDQGLTLSVPIEIEGVRLIADLVAAGAGVSIIPETAVPPTEPGMRSVAIADMPPRRLALVTARGVRLSLADAAVRDAVVRLVRAAKTTERARGQRRTAGAARAAASKHATVTSA